MLNSDGYNTKSKNSKQKILQLKEELNKGVVDFDPRFEKLKVLRECYDITRNRLNEFLLTTNKNLYVQANTNRASKIYSAMSTLIYTSICCTKCDELEAFIRKSAITVPTGIIDLDEWNSILKIARDCREGSSIAHLLNENNLLKQSLNVSLFLASDPLQTVRSELTIMRKDIGRELAIAQGELGYAMEIVKGLTEQLHNKCNSEHNAIKLDALAKDYKNLLHNYNMKEEEIERYKSQDLQLKNEYDSKILQLEEQYLMKLSTVKLEYEEQIARKEISSNEFKALNSKLSDSNNLLNIQLTNANDKINELHIHMKEIQSLHTDVSDKNNVLNIELVTAKDDINNLHDQINNLQRQLVDANNHIVSLTEIKTNKINDMNEIELSRITEINRLNQLMQEMKSEKDLKDIEMHEKNIQLQSLSNEVIALKAELVSSNLTNHNQIIDSNPSNDSSDALTSKDSNPSNATTMVVTPLVLVELEALKAEYSILQTKLITESTEHAKLRAEFNSINDQKKNNDVVQNTLLPTEESIHLMKDIQLLRTKLTSYNTSIEGTLNPNAILIETLLNQSKADILNEVHNVSELNTMKLFLEATEKHMITLNKHQSNLDSDRVTIIESLTNENKSLQASIDKLSASVSEDTLSVMLPLVNEVEDLKNERSKLLKDKDRNKQETEEKIKILELEISTKSKEKEVLTITLNDIQNEHIALQTTTEEEIKALKEQMSKLISQQQEQQQKQLSTTTTENTTILVPMSTNMLSPRGLSNGSSAQAIAQYAEKQGLHSMTIQELSFKIVDLQRKLSDSELLLRQSKDMLYKFNITNVNESNPTTTTTPDNIITATTSLSEQSFTLKSAIELFLSTGKMPRHSLVTNAQGVLKAYAGTTQGSTGWYMNQDQLYYFVVENGKYLLLCGPIHEDVYKLSIEELEKVDIKSDSSSSYPLNLSIDRLAIHATRVQIETLLDDLWHLDDLLKNTVDELNLFKSLVDKNQIESIHEDDGSEVLVNKNSDAFVKLTSLTRGFIIRSRMKKMRANKDAMESGILFAMNNTIQGQTGWYTGPNNQIFYFVLKDGNWVHTLGPIKETEFEEMRINRKLQHKNKSEGILYKCNLPLFEAHAELQDHGELYITSGKSLGKLDGDKLYIAIPIDSFMPSLTLSDQVSFDGEGSIDDMSLYSSSVNNNYFNNSLMNTSQILDNSITGNDNIDNVISSIEQEDSEVLFEHFIESPLERENPSREQPRPKSSVYPNNVEDNETSDPISKGDEHIAIIISPSSHEMPLTTNTGVDKNM